MSFFSFGKRPASSVVALFDIGDTSIGASVVRMTEHDATVLFATRAPIIYQKSLDVKRLIESAKTAVDIAAGRLAHAVSAGQVPGVHTVGDIGDVVCVLSSPWYIGHAKQFIFSQDKPFSVSKTLVERVVAEHVEESAKAAGVEIGDTGNAALVEKKLLQVSLNGYPTDDPYGKVANRLEIVAYLGFGSRFALSAIRESLLHFFHDKEPSFHTFPLAASVALGRLFPKEPQFFVIHITGEVTDISVIKDSYLSETLSFPSGKNSILRAIEKASGAGETEALSALRLAAEGHPATAKMKTALTKARTLWLEGLSAALAPLSEVSFLCEHVFLIADEEALPWFDAALRSYQEESAGHLFLSVMPLTPAHAGNLVAGKLPGGADVPLSLCASALPLLSRTAISLPKETTKPLIHRLEPPIRARAGARMEPMDPEKKPMQDVFPPTPNPAPDRSIRNITLDKEPRRPTTPPSPMPDMNRRQSPPPFQPYTGSHASGGGRHYVLWAVAALFLAVVAFVAFSFLWSGASVVVTPKSATVVVDGTFTASKGGEAGSVPFETMTATREATRSVSAQGTETVNTAASGQITVYNAYSSTPQKLIANTRFQTAAGLIFRIHDAISIPGYKKSGSTVTPGSITVTVYADQAGDQYNIDATDFTVPGLKGDPRETKVYARSSAAMTGGFSGTRPKIQDSDLKTAEAAMEQELSAGLKADAQGQIPDGYVLYPDAQFITFDPVTTAAGSDASSVTLHEKGTLTGMLFAKDKLAAVLIQTTNTPTVEGVPVSIVSPESLTFSIQNKTAVKPSDASFSFTLSGNAKIVWGFDDAKFKSDLAGKTKSALQTVLTGYPGIESASVSLRPFWQGSFPSNPDKITVETASVK